ncbi:putative ATP-dependent helicase IRC3 [Thecaphora frezii]
MLRSLPPLLAPCRRSHLAHLRLRPRIRGATQTQTPLHSVLLAIHARSPEFRSGLPGIGARDFSCGRLRSVSQQAAAPFRPSLARYRDPRDGADARETETAQATAYQALRPYQEECVQDCLAAIQSGITRIGVSSPTGSGKTTIFTHLIDRIPPRNIANGDGANRVLVLVNSIELALQAAASISSTFPEKLVEIEQGAKFRASGHADVTVATIQTLHRSRDRLEKLDRDLFKAVIVDEAHHAAAPSYRDVLAYFDPSVGKSTRAAAAAAVQPEAVAASTPVADGAEAKIPIIGFSATFSRHDGLALGKVFERIVFHKDFLEMIGEKWLCPIRFTSIKADIDLASVKLSSSSASADFQRSSLAAVVNTPVVNKLVLKAWIDRAHSQRRSTLIFAVNIQHVADLTATFRQAGIDARYLHGGTPMLERRQLLRDFRKGVFPVLVNCAILTEGADVPAIDCVLLARPTRSRNLFSQMIGRGLRLSPKTGKKDCLILDIVGNIEKGVVCTPTLFGLDPDEMIEDESVEALQERAEAAKAEGLDGRQGQGQGQAEEDALSLQSPTKLVYIDYEDPFELHRAMQVRSRIVETMSPNAWVDCGAQTYILDVPRYGFVRVERVEAASDAATAEPAEAGDGRPAAQHRWTAHFTPVNSDADERNAAMGHSHGPRPFYRRARHILDSTDLESAVRGSDQYVQKHILRGAPQLFAMLHRYAKWRGTRATDSQRKLVEKRLGLSKIIAAQAGGGDGGGADAGSSSSRLLATEVMTKGQASVILTRLMHGAKARWQQRAKDSNRIWRREEKERARREREMVQVGPLR